VIAGLIELRLAHRIAVEANSSDSLDRAGALLGEAFGVDRGPTKVDPKARAAARK
jgi:hypothetical protein